MRVEVTLAGPLRARTEAAEISGPDFGGRRPSVTFALLAMAGDETVSRDRLVDVLWPDGPPVSWVPGIRSVMTKVRTAIGKLLPDAGDVIVHVGDGYRLSLPSGVVLDVDVRRAFSALDAAATALAAGDAGGAAQLATDARVVLGHQFLPGEEGPWVGEVRHELHAARVRALELLARARIDLDQPALAAAVAAEAVRLEPYRESAHRLLIASYVAGGNRAEALRAYERCRRLLAEELGVDPAPETEALYLTLLGDEPAPRPRVVTPSGWRMVGRDDHLAALEQLLAGAATGAGAVALVTGDAGMGKTRLARELAARAASQNAAVLWGTCREPEWSAPYSALTDVVPELAGVVPEELAIRLEHRFDERSAPANVEPLAVREDFRRAVLSAGFDRPVVLVVDDVQWADDGTLAALRHLAPSVLRARVLVLLTRRDDQTAEPRPMVDDAMRAITREPGVTRIALAGLDDRAVAELVEQALPGAPEWLGRTIRIETGGSPFLVQATLVHLVESGALERVESGERTPQELLKDVPDVVRDVVTRRLDGLSPPARELLRTAAMFEGSFRIGDVAVATNIDEAVALDGLDEALALRLVVDAGGDETYQFGHAILRNAIASEASAARRSRLHRRVAEAIEARAGGRPTVEDSRELAGQYRASAALPGAERGVVHAVRAADHAEATGAYDTAASLLGIALDLAPGDHPERDQLASRRGIALVRATRYDEGAALVLEVADRLTGAGERRAAAAVVADAAWASEMAGGSPAAFKLAAAGLPLTDDDQRDDVWARLTILDLRRREGDEPRSISVPIDVPERRQAARLLYAVPELRGQLAWGVWDSRAEILERGTDDMHALTFWAGRYREALPLWQRAAAAAEGRGLVSEAVNDWAGAARCAVALGHFADAESMIEYARELARRIDLRGSFALQLLAAKDDLVHARDAGYDDLWSWSRLLTSERSDRAQRWAEAAWFASGARAFALEGRADDARSLLDGAAEVLPIVPTWIVSTNRVVGDAAETMWVLGGHPAVEVIGDAVRTKLVEPDFRCPMTEPRLAMARVLGIEGKLDESREWFAAARTVCEEDGLAPLAAIVDYDEALLLARQGDTSGARPLAKSAAERSAELEMAGWLARAERLAAG